MKSNHVNQITTTNTQFKAWLQAKETASQANAILRQAEKAAGIDSVRPIDSTPWIVKNEAGRILGHFQPTFRRGYEVAETWSKGTIILD